MTIGTSLSTLVLIIIKNYFQAIDIKQISLIDIISKRKKATNNLILIAFSIYNN